ncbi:MAG: protein-L-isoaspartate O-methyltransferase [Gemmatimonadetes bacterium]|nr:protein-L-isoaspartate O-methyltransferase [Gemmatimonadota bacterium]
MVAEQIEARGVKDPRVLEVLRRIPRRVFVPDHLEEASLGDHALPIGHKQTISQPYIVGKMTELLGVRPEHRILEIGTGSGYQAAVLSRLADQVYSVEIVGSLADEARERLRALNIDNVTVCDGDGHIGWPDAAPFDRILLTAAPACVPEALANQLASVGRLVAPVGVSDQRIEVWDRGPEGLVKQTSIGVRFVPMVPANAN